MERYWEWVSCWKWYYMWSWVWREWSSLRFFCNVSYVKRFFFLLILNRIFEFVCIVVIIIGFWLKFVFSGFLMKDYLRSLILSFVWEIYLNFWIILISFELLSRRLENLILLLVVVLRLWICLLVLLWWIFFLWVD